MEKNRNFKFVILDEKKFKRFASTHTQESFMQTIELGNLKKKSNIIPHYVGVLENEKIICASLVLEQKSFLYFKTFYAPRGFLIDYYDNDLLKFFTFKLTKYVKKHNGFRIIIDPNVIYQVRSSDGDEINNKKYDDIVSNIENVGFKHFGFNLYFEAMQTRWAYRLELNDTYQNLKDKFSKSTRKNIDTCYKKGLRVRKGSIDDLPSMSNIFDLTSKRKDFSGRNLSYYNDMYESMNELMTIYVAYIDPDIYYKSSIENLNEEKKHNLEIENKMKVDMVGKKLINQKETSDRLIKKLEDEVVKAEKFKNDNPKGKDIGFLLSMKSGLEYLTLTSGILTEYKDFTPKYAMYDQHIKDAIDQGFKYVNLYGITGCFDSKSKYYGMYEFKKGFNGNVIELVGQFEKEIGFIGVFYSVVSFLKKFIKK